MSTLAEIARSATVLTPSQVAHLQRLTRSWVLVADISFSDLTLFARHSADPGEYVVLGSVRPSTGQTLYRAERRGTTILAATRPLLRAAFDTGEIADGGRLDDPAAARIRVLNIPVRHRDDVIAVVSREFSPDGQRVPGELELTYFTICRRIDRMIAEGTYPFPVDDTDGDDSPRVTDGVLLVDRSSKVEFASPNAMTALTRLGVPPELAGRRLVEVGVEQRAVRHALTSRLPQTEEIEGVNNSTIVIRCIPLVDGDEVSGGLVLTRDVSELRRRDRLLVSKNATIAEIHHRVKNNLQTISSMLRLQGRRLAGPEAKAAIDDSVRRIRSIAVVHEILSQDERDTVRFSDLIRPLVRTVEEGLISPDEPVRFVVEGDAGELPSELATQLAVVLTELLQNVVDHAHAADGGEVTVTISFGRTADHLRVVVVDDGLGLRSGFDLDGEVGLGLTIVRSIVSGQLGGSIAMRSAAGSGTRHGTIAELDVPLTSTPTKAAAPISPDGAAMTSTRPESADRTLPEGGAISAMPEDA